MNWPPALEARMRRRALAVICCGLHAAGACADARPLGPPPLPPAAPAAEISRLLSTCPPPPAPVRDIDLSRYYADADGSEIDPAKHAAHAETVEPLRAFLREMARLSDRAVARADRAAATCALRSLSTWADGRALLGTVSAKQAEYQRNWDLAGLSLAYFKIRPYATRSQRAAIEPWIGRVAAATRAFFDQSGRRRNNHLYWHGLAMMGTALATDDEASWSRSRDIYGDALRNIGTDGSLPLELSRKSRALHYHIFALAPLVIMAEIARLRGEDWYAMEGGALHRLAALSIRGLQRPEVFDALAGVRQQRPVKPQGGWLGLYAAGFRDRVASPLPIVSDTHRWIGGSAGMLARRAGAHFRAP